MSAAGRGAPRWTLAAPLAALGLFGAMAGDLVDGHAAPVLVLVAALLGAVVFAAIHHADVVALRIGQPFGAVVLAVSVTVIEVSLIVSIMLTMADAATDVARDTVFATVMIVLNGVVGLCLLIGGTSTIASRDSRTRAPRGRSA